MWSYYGSKSKIVHLYPAPIYPKIIEPFAGTARYSLRYYDRDILLVDKYDVIVDIWKWLQKATKEEILSLPMLDKNELIPDEIQGVQRDFLGFLVVGGASKPQFKVTSFDGVNVPNDLKRTAKQLFKIRKWEIKLGDYFAVPNQEATWFIDPPYQFGGDGYVISNKDLDYQELAEWCKSRKGQVIVCENSKADWLPFKPLKILHGQVHKTQEVIWSNLPTVYDYEQLSVFDLLKEE